MQENSCNPDFLLPAGEGLACELRLGHKKHTVEYWSQPQEYTWVFVVLLFFNFCSLNILHIVAR